MKKMSMINKINKKNKISSTDIEFEDEVIIEENKFELYIPTDVFDVERIFGLKYIEDVSYNVYLEFDSKTQKGEIEIVEVKDDIRKYYRYILTDKENTMFQVKIKEYLKRQYNKTMEEYEEY